MSAGRTNAAIDGETRGPGVGSNPPSGPSPRLIEHQRRLRGYGARVRLEQIVMEGIGAYCKAARREQGLTRKEMAQKMRMDKSEMQAFEIGLIPMAELPDDFMQHYLTLAGMGDRWQEVEQEMNDLLAGKARSVDMKVQQEM